MRNLLFFSLLFFPLIAFAKGNDFVTVHNGKLMRDGKPYRFIGVNYWYGPLIAAPHGGDRARLKRELDLLQKVGVTNVRSMVGVDGVSTYVAQLPFPLQKKPGVYDDNTLPVSIIFLPNWTNDISLPCFF